MRTAIVAPGGIGMRAIGTTAVGALVALIAGSVLGVTGAPSDWIDLALRIVLTEWAAPPAA